MGFFKFLKRDKGSDLDIGLDELDAPPTPPPTLAAKGKEPMPQIPADALSPPSRDPAFTPQDTAHDIENIQLPSMEGMPALPEPTEDLFLDKRQLEEEPMQLSKSEPIPSQQPIDFGPIEKESIEETRQILVHKDAAGPIYVRMDRFRVMLGNIQQARSSLRDADKSLVKVSDIDENRDKLLEQWKVACQDLQKKLIFVDKTIFKR